MSPKLNLYAFHFGMPPIVYTDERAKISEQLWKETTAELSFANAATIVEEASK